MMWVGWACLILFGGVAFAPFAIAAHTWVAGVRWRRRMRKEWERDANAARWGDVRITNDTGQTLH